MERICEMGQVMRRAVQVDDQHYCSVRERLAQLEVNRLHHKKKKGRCGFIHTVSENDINCMSLVGNIDSRENACSTIINVLNFFFNKNLPKSLILVSAKLDIVYCGLVKTI